MSIVASGLAAATAYLVARRFARSGAACAGALGLGLSPIAWTFGETAVPYELLALGSISIAGAFHASRGRPDRTIAASLLWGLAAGFRQDLLVILGPLWLWTIAPVAWRDRAIAAGSVAAGCGGGDGGKTSQQTVAGTTQEAAAEQHAARVTKVQQLLPIARQSQAGKSQKEQIRISTAEFQLGRFFGD